MPQLNSKTKKSSEKSAPKFLRSLVVIVGLSTVLSFFFLLVKSWVGFSILVSVTYAFMLAYLTVSTFFSALLPENLAALRSPKYDETDEATSRYRFCCYALAIMVSRGPSIARLTSPLRANLLQQILEILIIVTIAISVIPVGRIVSRKVASRLVARELKISHQELVTRVQAAVDAKDRAVQLRKIQKKVDKYLSQIPEDLTFETDKSFGGTALIDNAYRFYTCALVVVLDIKEKYPDEMPDGLEAKIEKLGNRLQRT